MALSITPLPVPLEEDAHGVVRVGGTRVPLESVLHLFNRGASPEAIARSFSTLELADIYTVIGYYLRHRPEVDVYLKRVAEEEEEILREIESRPGYREVRERLLARRAAPSHAPE
jgi:uncharacterized protein (DUF433 family)